MFRGTDACLTNITDHGGNDGCHRPFELWGAIAAHPPMSHINYFVLEASYIFSVASAVCGFIGKTVCPVSRPSQKFTSYRTLYTLNQRIELVLLTFSQLEELGVVEPDQLRPCRIITEELQARANHEVTEALRKREDDDSVRLQNLRLEWDAKLRLQGNNVPTQKRTKEKDTKPNANKSLPVRQKLRQQTS